MNTLEHENSLYLKQHSQNPIHWKAWNEDTKTICKEENKPVFISIGYSSCHYCHRMNKESFSNLEIANFLNENFNCIKIDREEFPEVDYYYQLASQATNGRGGWPLSVFATSDLSPFFIGTYFPPEQTGDVPSFMQVLMQIKKDYKEKFNELYDNALKIKNIISAPPKLSEKIQFEGHFPHPESILNALKNYKDHEDGGYGSAPKFPQLSFYEWAIEHMLEGMISQEEGNHILFTLERILMGGIYDHAKGGLHRYSTDKTWTVPHFEKMLYDQASLLKVLIKASLLYQSPLFLDSIVQTLEYLRTEMLSEGGYFFSSQDADSEGEEGLYFTFTLEEFETAIEDFDSTLKDHLDKLKLYFNITEEGNFHSKLNVLTLNPSYKNDFYGQENWELIRRAKQAILEARKFRIPPATDKKGLSSWNFMILTSLINVIQYSQYEGITRLATDLLNQTFETIHKNFLVQSDKTTLLHSMGSSKNDLFEDYVMFAECELRFYEISANEMFLKNGIDTLLFIKNMFLEKEEFKNTIVRGKSLLHNNLHAPLMDQAHKSPVATYISLVRKYSLIEEVAPLLKELEPIIDNLKQVALSNPLLFGESLRALTYPELAYKKIEIPKNYREDKRLQPLFSSFPSRFFIKYTENKDWQICNHKECELTGKDIESFVKVFKGEEQ